ncbi:unnamed protein product [Arabis nemorensis]|uniref:Uncharacterized protein n=1 Tax=Arabis nemorensis TaxID=586526 RepID=A0A565ATX8_9BRAS|nr:unnamed protein product [Arabis nemorensis]
MDGGGNLWPSVAGETFRRAEPMSGVVENLRLLLGELSLCRYGRLMLDLGVSDDETQDLGDGTRESSHKKMERATLASQTSSFQIWCRSDLESLPD